MDSLHFKNTIKSTNQAAHLFLVKDTTFPFNNSSPFKENSSAVYI